MGNLIILKYIIFKVSEYLLKGKYLISVFVGNTFVFSGNIYYYKIVIWLSNKEE